MAGNDENPYTMPPRPGQPTPGQSGQGQPGQGQPTPGQAPPGQPASGRPPAGPARPGSPPIGPGPLGQGPVGQGPAGQGQRPPAAGSPAPAASAPPPSSQPSAAAAGKSVPPPAPGVRHGPAIAPRAAETGYLPEEPSQPTVQAPQRKSRLLPLTIAVLALGGFAAIVWYAYSWGTGEAPPGELPVVTAERDLGEVKERPEEPGGLEVPHQDAEVMNDRGGSGTEGGADPEQVERLLPPPESPQPPEPIVEAPIVEDPAAEAASDPTAGSETEGTAGVTVDDLPTVPPAPPQLGEAPTIAESEGPTEAGPDEAASGETPAAEAPEPPPPATEAPTDLAAEESVEVPERPAVPPLSPSQPETAEPTPPAPAAEEPAAPDTTAQTATPETAATPAPAPTAGAAGVQSGDWVLQMAALRDQAAVDAEWARLQSKHPNLLGSLTLVTQTVTVEGQGVFHRLQAGPLPNRATATDLCGLLQAAGTDCLAKQH
ncbi:MAG: SPOR domain-containing protein [Kiloniellales bacterium]